MKNVRLNQCAVGNQKGELTLALQEYPPQTSIIYYPLGHHALRRDLKTIPIFVCTVDEYCVSNNISNIDLMKIDVEGAELLVLKGASNAITTFRPELIIELHERHSQPFGYLVQDTLNYLHMLGYELFDVIFGITKPHLTAFSYDVNPHQSRHIVIARPLRR